MRYKGPRASYEHRHRKVDGNTWFDSMMVQAQHPDLRGYRIYFSGVFYYTVQERPQIVHSMGAKIANKFSKTTVDLLVLGERYGAAKLPKAEAWDIPMIDDAGFWTHPQVIEVLKTLGYELPHPTLTD